MNPDAFDIDAALDRLLDAEPQDRAQLITEFDAQSPGAGARLTRLVEFALGGGGLPDTANAAAPNLFADLFKSQDSERIGARVGPYVVTSLINHGGMGVVFRAKRADGAFEQTVAVKFLPKLAQSSQRRALFLRERANLARLEHPNIARIIDAGITEDETPYFLMEYVDGTPMHEAVDGLPMVDRLQLFEDLCVAVAYCHQSLIVHGDLKPNNVLVANGRVRLLDFGIANFIEADEDSTRGVAYTAGYAAPEIESGEPPSVLSDVYALGILLRDVLQWSEDGVQRAKSQGHDLAHIILRCTEADVSARYSSVDALLADLRAHRLKQPISDRAQERSYVIKRFIARNRTLVAATIGIVMSLGVGLATALWQYGLAKTEATRARETATFVRSLFDRIAPEFAGKKDVTLKQLMDEAARRLDIEMRDAPEVRNDLMGLIGSGYYGIGEYEKARELRQRALDYLKSTHTTPNGQVAAALRGLSVDYQRAGDYIEARKLILEAERQFRTLGYELEAADSRSRYGMMMMHEPQVALAAFEAERNVLARLRPYDLMLRAINLTRLGGAYDALGDYTQAAEQKLRALQLADQMGERLHPTFITTLCNLALTYQHLRDWDVALATGERCIDATRQRYSADPSSLISPYLNQGAAYLRLEQPDKAWPLLEQAAEFAVRELPPSSVERMAAEANLARLQIDYGDASAAIPTLENLAQRMAASVGEDNASTARLHSLLGRAFFKTGDNERALQQMGHAEEILRDTPRWHIEGDAWVADLKTWMAEVSQSKEQ